MKPLLAILWTVLPLHIFAQVASTNSSILGVPLSVFRIFYNTSNGASFTIVVDDRQYLITAEHVVRGIKKGDTIYLKRTEGEAHRYTVTPILCENTNVDIIALALPEPIRFAASADASADGIALGQDINFYGFPLGFYNNIDDYVIPFVGKGIVSAADNRVTNAVAFYFHAMNVQGFSGGPIFFVHHQTRQPTIAAVVSGFPLINGAVSRQGTNTDMQVQFNSGIMVGYKIDHIKAAIKKNPIGPLMK